MRFISSPLFINAGAVLLFCLLGLWLVGDYGVILDEYYHIDRAQTYLSIWQALWEGKEIEMDRGMYYGSLFNLLAWPFQESGDFTLLQNYTTKHIVTFFFSLLSYGALAIAFKRTLGCRYGLVFAIATLALMPSYFGHSFNNPKDLPFAALYLLCSVILGIRIGNLLQRLPLTRRQWLAEGAIVGGIIALNASIRLAGLAVGVSWGVTLFALYWMLRPSPVRHRFALRQFVCIGIITAITAAIGLLVAYPASLINGLQWFEGNYKFLQQGAYHDWICRYINGTCYLGHELPFYYLPVYFFVKMPLLHLFFGCAGLILMIKQWRSHTLKERAIILMILLQLILIPAMIIGTSAKIHDAERHFLFMFPAWAYFSFYGLWHYWRSYAHPYAKASFVMLITVMAGWIVKNMIELHPYQYAYMNEPVRALPLDRNWELDYWGLCSQPLAEYAFNHSRRGGILVGLPRENYKPLRHLGWDVREDVPKGFSKPYYYAGFVRQEMWGWEIPDCPIVHVEERQLDNQVLSFGILRYCPDGRPLPKEEILK